MSLDLVEQHLSLESNGQFRFTPPTHTFLAFRTAIREYRKEGGLEGRAARYRENQRLLLDGMARLGYRRLVHPQHASYIITAFLNPTHANFDFKIFYTKLTEKGEQTGELKGREGLPKF
ncbi:2-aminoethylphosphonate--pyruvate transaminase [Portunus trituberculatus]|uniref:2-aminoethylphosphonate--pyruvate transaminase n=1 Tax=Portunus trituberculatus TaxID=210409 RepID=A0A5B7DJD2_PORTR|nr:2-aminoethylphosphonate--pyruvate transaminase [Portunus trituberculatus]